MEIAILGLFGSKRTFIVSIPASSAAIASSTENGTVSTRIFFPFTFLKSLTV